MSNTGIVLETGWLRSHAVKAHFFGLGFIQVKLNERQRLHFYDESIPAFVEEPHDHRYGFVSNVLRGALTNRIFKLAAGDDHVVSYESCRQNGPETPSGFGSGLVSVGSFTVRAGSGYYIDSETFHTVHPEFEHGPVVTMVERELPFKEFARSVHRVGAEVVCPFSRPMPDDELWRVVERCLS
jgi:hypothetical protein